MSAELLLSIAAIGISAGALTVSIISLRMQSRTRAEQRTTAVEVRIAEHVLGEFVMPMITWAGDTRPMPPPWLKYTVRVVVHNRGERSESLRELGAWDLQRHYGQAEQVGESLPPGGAVERTLEFKDELLALAAEEGFVAVAELGSGEEIVSGSAQLEKSLLEELRANVREREAFRQ